LFPILSLKDILLIDGYPRQIALLLAKLLTQSSELFFLLEQLLASIDPFFLGNDLVII
jgi:hypothetical protein